MTPGVIADELPQVRIRLHGITAQTVAMDPFLGLGSSAIAARNCGIPTFIGFEIDDHYLGIAEERLSGGGSA